jgi:hypothetical protein
MKKKGFGKSQASIKEAKKFILAFQDCGIQNNGDNAKFEQFIKDNLEILDESLLEVFPLVFRKLIDNKWTNERKYIARIFAAFGSFIMDCLQGNHSLNIELSITMFNLVLKVLTYQEFPKDWAMMQYNLGCVYSKRIQGKRAENLEKGIDYYKKALKIYTFHALPEYWARIQNNLGE